jgi:hypothetical protein
VANKGLGNGTSEVLPIVPTDSFLPSAIFLNVPAFLAVLYGREQRFKNLITNMLSASKHMGAGFPR